MDFGWHYYLPLSPLPANLCSLTRTCHQPQSPWLCMEAVISLAVTGTVSPTAAVGSAFWMLCEMDFPACAVAEPQESPFPLHPGPDGDPCPVPFAMPSAKSYSCCQKSITVLLAHIWHLQRSNAALTGRKALPTVHWQCSDVENPLQGRNAPLFWFPLQYG